MLDNLETILKRHKKGYSIIEYSIVRIQAILSHTPKSNESEMQDTLQKFEEFLKNNEDDKDVSLDT